MRDHLFVFQGGLFILALFPKRVSRLLFHQFTRHLIAMLIGIQLLRDLGTRMAIVGQPLHVVRRHEGFLHPVKDREPLLRIMASTSPALALVINSSFDINQIPPSSFKMYYIGFKPIALSFFYGLKGPDACTCINEQPASSAPFIRRGFIAEPFHYRMPVSLHNFLLLMFIIISYKMSPHP